MGPQNRSFGYGVLLISRTDWFHLRSRALPPNNPTTAPPGRLVMVLCALGFEIFHHPATPACRMETPFPGSPGGGTLPASLKLNGSSSFCSHICQSVPRNWLSL